LASCDATIANVMPEEGKVACSFPERSSIRSGAVSAARSRSITHLNLSQPLGSSAANSWAELSKISATESDVLRISIYRDHYIRGFHNDNDGIAGFDPEIIDRFVRDC
jgi:hypothetical protein